MLVSKFDNKLKNDGYNVSQWRPEMRRRNFFLQHNSFKDARRHLISFVFVQIIHLKAILLKNWFYINFNNKLKDHN